MEVDKSKLLESIEDICKICSIDMNSLMCIWDENPFPDEDLIYDEDARTDLTNLNLGDMPKSAWRSMSSYFPMMGFTEFCEKADQAWASYHISDKKTVSGFIDSTIDFAGSPYPHKLFRHVEDIIIDEIRRDYPYSLSELAEMHIESKIRNIFHSPQDRFSKIMHGLTYLNEVDENNITFILYKDFYRTDKNTLDNNSKSVKHKDITYIDENLQIETYEFYNLLLADLIIYASEKKTSIKDAMALIPKYLDESLFYNILKIYDLHMKDSLR